MNSILLSRITKDFLETDRASISKRRLCTLAWSGSTLASLSPKKKALPWQTLFRNFKDRDSNPLREFSLSTAPKLQRPASQKPASLGLPRYFSRGALDQKTPAPIPYLLTESNEISQARPVPGKTPLLRSLCKGKGTLRQNKQGLVYLDIDDRFISSLIPYLKSYGLVRPPYFNLFAFPDGAHVPVIPAREVAFQYLNHITELDQEFTFEIEGLYSLEPTLWPEVEQVWFFKIRSPDLETLRRRYFLPALPGGHSFHIAIAVKPRPTSSHTPRPLPLMRINVGFLAA